MQLQDFKFNRMAIDLNKVKIDPEDRRKLPSMVSLDGAGYRVTDRFWRSFQSLYALGDTVFRYYSHREVFERITAKKTMELNVVVEHAPVREGVDNIPSLLALTKANNEYPNPNDVVQSFGGLKPLDVRYFNGLIEADFPHIDDKEFRLNSETFNERFTIEFPIDGWGKASTYISLLRQVCQNGLVVLAPAFKRRINIGKEDPLYMIEQFVGGYSNPDAYLELRARLSLAQRSPASIRECGTLIKTLYRFNKEQDPQNGSRIDKVFSITGDFYKRYGIAGLKEVNNKTASNLPSECTVYDLINMATELASHHCTSFAEQRSLNAFAGDLLAKPYDLEGYFDEVPQDFTDVFFSPKTDTMVTVN